MRTYVIQACVFQSVAMQAAILEKGLYIAIDVASLVHTQQPVFFVCSCACVWLAWVQLPTHPAVV